MTEPSRLDTIEIKLAHLEQALQELGETVMRQQRDIELLSARNRTLKEQLESIEGSGANSRGFETPPPSVVRRLFDSPGARPAAFPHFALFLPRAVARR